ncbi:MAG: PrsW family intramembrane metalloprotease [Treponema sp.]|nr:PrsW family intramembrane metalloprotease [Treponema sp.]
MNIYASIAMAFIPLVTVYICFLLLGKDFNKVHGAAACLCGLLALLPIELLLIIIHTWHPFASVNLPGRLIKGLLINGIIEESAKMAFLFLLPAKKSKLSAFFSYAVLCGLTLGCLETLIYLIYGNRSITLRLFTAVVMHTFCAGLSGLFVFSIKCRAQLKDKSFLWLPFLLAVLFHGLYNYYAGIYGALHYLAYVVIAVTILECKLRYQSVKIKFDGKVSESPELTTQGDAKKMGFGNFFKKILGSSEEAAEKTQVQESAQTVAEDDATIADDSTMVDSDSTLVSEDNSSDETISSDVQADMSFALHTSAEFASDKPRTDDKFTEALNIKIDDVFDEDKEPQPDPISETEAFESIEKAVTPKSTRGRKKGSTAKEAKATVKKAAKTAEKKATAAKKAVTKKATTAKKTAEKAVKEAKTTAKKTAKTAKTAAKKTAAKAAKTTAAKATKAKKAAVKTVKTAKKAAVKTAKTAKAAAEKKVSAAKKTAAKTTKSAAKATKATAAKKTATAKATVAKAKAATAKKTAAKKPAAKKTTK